MLKVLGIAAAVVLAAYLGLAFWLSQSDFMSEGEGFGATVGVENRTADDLTFEAFADGDEWIPLGASVAAGVPLGSVSAGGWYGEGDRVGRDGCTYVPIRALDPSGREVARHPPPLCDGDVWVIEPSSPAPS